MKKPKSSDEFSKDVEENSLYRCWSANSIINSMNNARVSQKNRIQTNSCTLITFENMSHYNAKSSVLLSYNCNVPKKKKRKYLKTHEQGKINPAIHGLRS